MRMTNKIMQNNSLYNINNNKLLQDKLSTQMSTNKKITRPSDDPVIAIRALRLRSDVSEVTQFYAKNVPDAEAWLKVTADALDTTTEVIKNLVELAGKGANEKSGYDDLDIILTQLKSLRDEFYSTGNVDFAGRYIFTGYRTDTTLTYTEDSRDDFTICEKLDASAVDTLNYTSIGNLKGISKENYDPATAPGPGESEQNVKNANIYRIRLAYDNLKGKAEQQLSVKYVTDATKTPPIEADLFPTGAIEYMSSTESNPNAYEYIQQNPDKAVLIPETGELLIGNDLYEAAFKNNPAVTSDTQLRVSYEKNSWKKNDLRPQHYFECTNNDQGVNYNWSKDAVGNEYISMEGENQFIEYDVGYNQRIRINTTAGEVFSMDLDRIIDDLENALAMLKEIDTSKDNMKAMLDGMEEGEAGYDNMKKTYDAVNKAYTYIRENVQKKFEHLITQVQGIQSNTSTAITDNGTRSSRLELVQDRLMTQKTTFETLQSSNEDIDITEVMIQLTSMGNSYNSALMATSKIMQNSLMNYI